MRFERLLFASCHGYLDPSSGAALASRDLLELLAARGTDCRALTTGVLDFAEETSLEAVIAQCGTPAARARADLAGGGDVEVFDLELGGVRVTILPTASSRIDRAPGPAESAAFLDLAGQVVDRFRPQILLTFGGHPTNRAMMAMARRRGVPVVFPLHNFAYHDRRALADVAGFLVPSEFARRHYARTLGLDCAAIPCPLRPERVVAADPAPEYLTFVNPIAAKGVTAFARIAVELGHRRPDIPILVVEGRGTAGGLAGVGLDLSGLRNLHRMANTPDPRDFYRVSRALLVPSLWDESFGRVAAEALANGLPVLASDRGALPETLGAAGIVLPIPARCTPDSGVVPTAREMGPWLAAVERLWDDPAFEAEHRARALVAAGRWSPERLVLIYRDYFENLASSAIRP